MFFALVLDISKSFPVTIFIIIGIRTLKLLLYRKHRLRDWRTDVLTWCSFTLSLYLYRTADWSGIVSWNTRVKLLSMAVVLLLRWISPVRVAFQEDFKLGSTLDRNAAASNESEIPRRSKYFESQTSYYPNSASTLSIRRLIHSRYL